MHLYAFRGFDEEGSARVIKYYDPSEVDARIAELQKYLRALVAQCERSPDGNVPIAGCTCAVCDLAREAALVASSL